MEIPYVLGESNEKFDILSFESGRYYRLRRLVFPKCCVNPLATEICGYNLQVYFSYYVL